MLNHMTSKVQPLQFHFIFNKIKSYYYSCIGQSPIDHLIVVLYKIRLDQQQCIRQLQTMQENFVKENQQRNKPEKPCCLVLLVVGLLGAASLVALFSRTPYSSPLFCSGGAWGRRAAEKTTETTQLELEAILHYATSTVVPQQSHGEITVTLDVLRSVAPCNFLVFGLGHDSLMWASLNPRGTTFFLEEDPAWFKTALKDAPWLDADTVPYRTQLSEADKLLQHFQTEPSCRAKNSFLRGNSKCRLALNMLSDKVYDAEWDAIMIDAPRGYFAEAPGRMAAIYSAAVMARNRKKSGVTHVFLHDVDRRVEKMYAEKFLCRKHLVKAVGRLWHFEIPPAATNADTDFC